MLVTKIELCFFANLIGFELCVTSVNLDVYLILYILYCLGNLHNHLERHRRIVLRHG